MTFRLPAFLSNIFSSKDPSSERGEYLATLLAVGAYTDFRFLKEEREEAVKILEKELFSKAAVQQAEIFMDKKIALYKEKEYKFNNDKKYVLTNILENNLWEDAEYLTRIFKADGELSDEECELSACLVSIVDNRKYIKQKLNI